MTTLEYQTRGRPAGDTIEVLPNYEERGISQESFNGKHVITGGHNRPRILENKGDSVDSHLMGIKRPLLSPTVSIQSGGKFTGNVQVAVQRVHEASNTRGGISPVWPNAKSFITDGDYTWTNIAEYNTFGLGAGSYYSVGFKVSLGTLIADSTALMPFGSESNINSDQLVVNSLSFFGYVPDGGTSTEGVAAPNPPAVRAAIFKGTNGSLTQVSPWVDRAGSTLPTQSDKEGLAGSPKITFEFGSPVTLDGANDTEYWFIIQTREVSKTLNLFIQELDGGTGSLYYATSEDPASATFVNYTTSYLLRPEQKRVFDEVMTTSEEPGDNIYNVSDMKFVTDGVDEWIYIAVSPTVDFSTARLRADQGVIIRFKKSDPVGTRESIKIDGVGWMKICPDPADNGDIYIAGLFPAYSGVPTIQPFQSYVKVLRRNFDDDSNDADDIYELTSPGTDSFLLNSANTDRLVAFAPIPTARGGGGALMMHYTRNAGDESALIRFSSDFSTYQEHKNTSSYKTLNDLHADVQNNNRFWGYSTHGGDNGPCYIAFSMASGLTTSTTYPSGVGSTGNTNAEGVVAIDPQSTSSQITYASHNAGTLLKGTNSASGWATSTPATLDGLTIRSLAVSPTDANYLHGVLEDASGNQAPYYSADAGATWALYAGVGTTINGLLANRRTADDAITHLQPTFFSDQSKECFYPVEHITREIDRQEEFRMNIRNQIIGSYGLMTVNNFWLPDGVTVSDRSTSFPYETIHDQAVYVDASISIRSTTTDYQELGVGTASSIPSALQTSIDAIQAKLPDYGDIDAQLYVGPQTTSGALTRSYWTLTLVATKVGSEYPYRSDVSVYTAPVITESATTMELLHSIERSISTGESDVLYWSVEDGKIQVNTSEMTQNEPESIAQGGNERYDIYSVLIREQSLGTEFREVARIPIGGSFTFDEPRASLGVKVSVHDGFYDTPGGFEAVANLRNGTDERLCFISQPGYDPFVGIPGENDYDYVFDNPNIVDAGSKYSIIPGKIGRVVSVDTAAKTLTLADVDATQWALLQAGDLLPLLSGSDGAGLFVSVADDFDPDSYPVSGVYTVEYTDYAYADSGVRPRSGMSLYSAYGRGTLGAVATISSAQANWYETLYFMTIDGDTSGFLDPYLGSNNNVVCIAGYFYYVRSYAKNQSGVFRVAITPMHPSFQAAPQPSVDDTVYATFAPIYSSLTNRVTILKDDRGYEAGRAYVKADSNTGLLTTFVNASLTKGGVRGTSPESAVKAEFRKELLATVKKGEQVVRLNIDVADDYWHQRKFLIEGDDYQEAYIDKVMEFDPESGVKLPRKALHLSSPWRGDDHKDSPCLVAGDYTSVHFSGTGLDQPEAISGLTKLNLVPKSRTAAIASASAYLYVFAEANEYFELQVPSFPIPRTGAEFSQFAIEAETTQTRSRGVFTITSKAWAADDNGLIYLIGPNGLYRVSSPNITLIPGSRKMFSRIDPDHLQRASLAFNTASFPRPMIHIAGIGYQDGSKTQHLGFIPDIEAWVNLSSTTEIDVITPLVNQQGMSNIAFGGAGTVGIFADMDRSIRHTDYPGPARAQTAYAFGAGTDSPRSGFIGTGDITVFDASNNIYAIDVTWEDSATEATRQDFSCYGTALNASLNAGELVGIAKRGVKWQKTNATTGAVEEVDVVGIKKTTDPNDAAITWTLYVQGTLSDTSASRYYWTIGARYFRWATNEITPADGKMSVQINALELDVSPDGSDDNPWWITFDVYTARGASEIDWSTPVVSRTIPHTRFKNEARQDISFMTPTARSAAIRAYGYAPVNSGFQVKRLSVKVQDI